MAYKISDGQVILDSKMMPRAEFQQPTRKCNDVKVGFQKHLDEPSSLIEVAQKTLIFATPKLWNTNYALQRLCVYYILPEVKNIEKLFFGISYFLVLFLAGRRRSSVGSFVTCCSSWSWMKFCSSDRLSI